MKTVSHQTAAIMSKGLVALDAAVGLAILAQTVVLGRLVVAAGAGVAGRGRAVTAGGVSAL